jgi:hypothetical protein
MKLEPPFQIDGRAIIRGRDGEVHVINSVTVTGVDSDGYVRMDIQPANTSLDPQKAPTKSMGLLSAKKRVYEVFRSGNDFQVIIRGPQSSRVVNKRISQQFLAQVFRKISNRSELRFNQIRSELPHVDSLQLKAALVILQLKNLVECGQEGKFRYYRKLREWSLAAFQ